MNRLSRLVLLALALHFIPVGFVAAQGEPPATPVPRIDICGGFAEAATPAAQTVSESSDANFDLAYVDMMITSHQNTIIMLLIAQERTEHPELGRFATDTVAARRGTIESLLAWRSEHYPNAAWVLPDQAMVVFDQVASENPGRGGIAGAREIAVLPHIAELCATGDQPFDLVLIDHLLTQFSGELLLTDSAQHLADDPALAATARDLATTFQRDLDALYAWRTLWYPNAEPPHAH
jgi:uncharacterized protein (DUF305 family)